MMCSWEASIYPQLSRDYTVGDTGIAVLKSSNTKLLCYSCQKTMKVVGRRIPWKGKWCESPSPSMHENLWWLAHHECIRDHGDDLDPFTDGEDDEAEESPSVVAETASRVQSWTLSVAMR